MESSRGGRYFTILLLALVIVGGLLRLRQYLACRSVWTDEAYLLINLAHATPLRVVTGPLDYVPRLVGQPNATQAGPPLALLTIRAFVVNWPGSELAARFLPFVSSLIALPLFAAVAVRMLSPAFALLAVALLAFADPVITQATNAKQYSSDGLAAVLMLFLATLRVPRRPLARLAVCAAAAVVLVWFSHPSVFVYAAASVALGYRALRGEQEADASTVPAAPARPAGTLLAWLAINVPPVVSFAALYWFSVRTQTDRFLRNYWAEGFADYSNPLAIPRWLVLQVLEASSYKPVDFTWMLPVLMFTGLVLGWRTGGRARFAATLFVGPLLFVVLASFMRQYPLVGKRLCFFLLPCAMLGAALGGDLLARRLGGRLAKLPLVALGVVAGASAIRAALLTIDPPSNGDVRAAARYVMERRTPGEPVYVWGGKASSVFYYYTPRPDEHVHLTANYRHPPAGETFWVVAQLGRWGTTTARNDERFEEQLEVMKQSMVLTDLLEADRVGAYRFRRK